MNFYIRLLSYQEANQIIEFVNQIVGCYSYITTGGVHVHYSGEIEYELIIREIEKKYPRSEVTDIPPHEINKAIYQNRKTKLK